MLFLVYSIGIAMAAIVAWIFKKTLFKAKDLPFVMELPPYRMPSAKSLVKHIWFRAEMYLKKMASFILFASLIIWALNYFPREVKYSKNYDEISKQIVQKYSATPDNCEINSLKGGMKSRELDSLSKEKNLERMENSYIGKIGKFIEPAMRPLGFDWRMGVSLLTGLAAKEVVVSTMGVLYQANPEQENSSLVTKIRNSKYTSGPKKGQLVYSSLVAFGYLMFVLLYFPCVAVVAAIRRESGDWKWAAFAVLYTTSLAWIVSFLIYQIGSLFM
jgi:ferrous iron transport protein B